MICTKKKRALESGPQVGNIHKFVLNLYRPGPEGEVLPLGFEAP